MNIHLVNNSKQSLGGGFTFLRTFEKYLKKAGVGIPEDPGDADVMFLSSASMVDRQAMQTAKEQGFKIVLRIDNIPRNSRNRNTGTSRLYDFAQMADLVIYQSEWARGYISPFVKKDGPVILNGADDDIFTPEGDAHPKDGDPQYLYVRFNRDETKSWHLAWYQYQMIQRAEPDAHLRMVGQFSKDLVQYGFDFFMGERFEYMGIKSDPEDLAEVYRGTDVLLAPYFNDACSNVIVEARRCGVPAFQVDLDSGGTVEIMKAPIEDLAASSMTARYVEEISRIM